MWPMWLPKPGHPHLIPQVLALLGLLATVLAAPSPNLEPEVGDLEAEMAVLDPEENDSIEQFEEHFHLPKVRWLLEFWLPRDFFSFPPRSRTLRSWPGAPQRWRRRRPW